MENLRWKDTPTYIPQCQEMEILTSEGDMDKQPETRANSKTSQGVSRVTYGAPTKQKNQTNNRNRTRDKNCQ